MTTDRTREISGVPAVTLYVCFFISGLAGLVYEVLWAKYLALYVGSTGLAQVIVLATFMGGLALGSRLLGSLADRVASPLKMYAFLEFGVGLYAMLFDRAFVIGRDVFFAVARAGGLTEGGLILGKIAACVLSILLPTFLMGGTLPALGRHMMRTMKTVGPRISRLYFLNSMGAAVGCIVAGFYLISHFGLQFSMIIGAILNVLAGVLALAVFGREPAAGPAKPLSAEEAQAGAEILPPWASAVILAGCGISGAIAMMYEVGWIRLLTLVLGSSTYCFSLMLATFIFGLALGSLLLSLKKSPTGYALIFGVSEVAVGLSVLLMLPFYLKLPYWFNQLSSSLSRDPQTFGLYQFCTFLLCALVMIVPTILQGITLPAAIKALVSDVRRLGSRIGYAYGINTIGTLIGSVAAGFLGLPFLGIKGTLELAVAVNCALGIAVIATEQRSAIRARAMSASIFIGLIVWGWYAIAMGPWDKQVLSAGVYRSRVRIPGYEKLLEAARTRNTVFYRDGIDATIAVQDIRDPAPERLLVINGKVDASTRGDMPTQKLMAHLPLILHPQPRKVLIVGIGSGATIGSVLAYPDVKQVDVVELSRDVIEASRLFESVNGAYWKDPRVHVLWEDAKTFLQVTREQYDVIISEPTNPWIAGIAGVFSREYFETCRRHLAPGGLFVQWVQAYELEDSTFFLILETFSSMFPCYTLWNPTRSDTVLVGSPGPYRPDFALMEKRMKPEPVKRDLAMLDVSSLLTILSMQMADHAERPMDVHWLGITHSDFFPILEYVAPRGFYVGASADGVKWLDGRSQSAQNAKLWIQDYLKDRKVGRAEFAEICAFSIAHPGLFDQQTHAWARKWLEQYPSDPQAAVLFDETASPSYAAGAVDFKDKTWGFIAGKLKVQRAFDEYLKTRSFFEDHAAEDLLDQVQGLAKSYPEAGDPDLPRWQGYLQYDLGRYRDAVRSLADALNLFGKAGGPRDDIVETASLRCQALVAAGESEKAIAAAKDLMAANPDLLTTRLLAARIRDEATVQR